MLSDREEVRSAAAADDGEVRKRQAQLRQILGQLNARERQIIIRRFGLEERSRAQTLREVGLALGVTKERVRQIEQRALSKLRLLAAAEKVESLS